MRLVVAHLRRLVSMPFIFCYFNVDTVPQHVRAVKYSSAVLTLSLQGTPVNK